MKKLCIVLLILLMISGGLLWNNSKRINELRTIEQQLMLEGETLNEQAALSAENLAQDRTEAENLKEEKKEVLKEREVWEQRTEEIQNLLSD